jgi:hypothetical protein
MTIHDAGDFKGKNVGVASGGFPRKFLEGQPAANKFLGQRHPIFYCGGLRRINASTENSE